MSESIWLPPIDEYCWASPEIKFEYFDHLKNKRTYEASQTMKNNNKLIKLGHSFIGNTMINKGKVVKFK